MGSQGRCHPALVPADDLAGVPACVVAREDDAEFEFGEGWVDAIILGRMWHHDIGRVLRIL